MDVTQDVFVRFLESELILPASKMRAWMYRTALRRYIDIYRRQQNYQEILRIEFFDTESRTVFDQTDCQAIRDLVAELPEKTQILVDLYYFQGFAVKEICQILGISASKAKVDLMRARQQMKTILEKAGLHHEDFGQF